MRAKVKIKSVKQDAIPPFTFHREFKKRFRTLFGGRIVYHYTSTEVLHEFAREEACLYATHCCALNDDLEFETGVRYVLQKYLPDNQKKLYSVLKDEMPEVIKALSDQDEKFEGKCTADKYLYSPWVMSFSREKDSLNQWIAYTSRKHGGVSVGFDFKKLERAVENEVTVRRAKQGIDIDSLSYELHFLPCFYIDEQDKKRMRDIKRFLDFLFIDYMHYQLSNIKWRRGDKRRFKAILMIIYANLFGAIAKNASFKSENEFRLVTRLFNYHYQPEFVF